LAASTSEVFENQIPEGLGGVDFEEFDASKFEPSLDEASEGGGAEAGGEGARAFFPDDLLGAPDLVFEQSRKRTSSVTVKKTTVALDCSNRKKKWCEMGGEVEKGEGKEESCNG
jgi:hypothetical protein